MEELIKNGDLENVKKLLESDECKYNDDYLWLALKYRQPECILYLFDYELKPKDGDIKKYRSGGIFDGEEFLSEWPCELIKLDQPLNNEEIILKKCLEQHGNISWMNGNIILAVLSTNKFTLLKNMYEMGALDNYLKDLGGMSWILYLSLDYITDKEMLLWILKKCDENFDWNKDPFMKDVVDKYKDDPDINKNESFKELVKKCEPIPKNRIKIIKGGFTKYSRADDFKKCESTPKIIEGGFMKSSQAKKIIISVICSFVVGTYLFSKL